MTSGNDPYVEHLRGQLGTLLDDLTPPAAPTAAVKRRGKAIRNRRRAGLAAGLVVAVVAAALVPSLLRQSRASGPISPPHHDPKVTVGTIGRGAPSGLIGRGTIDGQPWRISLTRQDNNLCLGISGDAAQTDCAPSDSYAATWPATLNGAGDPHTNSLYGTVTGPVTRVSVALSDDVTLNLRPVSFARQRWIALEVPAKLAVTRVVAYSRSRELAYAIPFIGGPGALPSFDSWLRPGEPVPGEFTGVIGSGVSAGQRWSMTIHAGPWGECAVAVIPADSGTVTCGPASRQPGLTTGSGDPAKGPWWIIGVARPHVSYLVLSMTDGSTRHVQVVRVAGVPYYAIAIFHGPRIAHWSAYDASGHRLYGGKDPLKL